jgi:membrane fusion protein
VSSVSRSPVTPAELSPSLAGVAHGVAGGMGVYRVTVDLERQHIDTGHRTAALKAGMAVDAVLLHERRRVIEWVLEPLMAALARQA